jgi:multisubunit Na+/H+ antiporter MnhG subunit
MVGSFFMKKPIVIIGAIVLIIGVVLIAVGAVGILRGLTVITTFSEPQSGQYVSTELRLNVTSGVAVTSAASNSALVAAQNLTLVNSTNIGQYAVTPYSSGGGNLAYTNLMGDYYYVAFASSQPSSKIVATPIHGGTLGSSSPVLGGFAVVIAGIVVIVVGVRMNRRPKRERSNSNIQTPATP